MDHPVSLSIWDRSTTVRFVRWLFRWRTLRRILIGMAWAVTIIALLYGEENWRGRRAWNRYRQDREASGVQFDYRAFIPKSIPAEQNFVATPFFEHLFARKGNGPDWPDDFSPAFNNVRRAEQGSREYVDLVAWEMALVAIRSGQAAGLKKVPSGKLDQESRSNAAAGVLHALKPSDDLFAELRTAGRRPSSRYPINYNMEDPWGILIPHLAPIKGAAQRLRLRACAELVGGQTQNALEDVKLVLRLTDSLKDEPFVTSYLVRVACVQMATQPVWEGLAEHRWSDGQLLELQAHFQKYAFLADLKLPVDAERAAGALTADLLYRKKYRLSDLQDQSDSVPFGSALVNLLGLIAPHGWYYQEQLNFCRVHERQLEGTLDVVKKRVYPRELELRDREMQRVFVGAILHHRLLAALLVPALNRLPLKAAVAQTAADQAAIACALERHRLATGQFPASLEALVPRYLTELPRDLLSGEFYRYRRTDDRHFILYSIGWNEKDDGGVPGNILFDEKQGDWVW